MTVVKIVPMPGVPGPQGPSGTANTGNITFNNIDIIGAGTASGDGYGNGTINLVPDLDLKVNNQYLIIDPTAPNHIHIRAGGTQDDSNAQLIFGGEQANVSVTDYNHQVSIQSYNSELDYGNYWTFGNDGVLTGPAMGGLWVEAISKKSEVYGLNIYSPVDIILDGGNGEFLNDSSIPNNQIATLGDLPTGATGSFVSQDSKTITVTNGIITNIEVTP